MAAGEECSPEKERPLVKNDRSWKNEPARRNITVIDNRLDER